MLSKHYNYERIRLLLISILNSAIDHKYYSLRVVSWCCSLEMRDCIIMTRQDDLKKFLLVLLSFVILLFEYINS